MSAPPRKLRAMSSSAFEHLVHQLALGDPEAIHTVILQARTSGDPLILVAAALFGPNSPAFMDKAAALAVTTRERQLVAIASAHLHGERDLVDALARDHLVDHPDNVLVAWIAAASNRKEQLS